jgi:peptidyl-prolyl cis-trans isomerase A (cyclophilin A)
MIQGGGMNEQLQEKPTGPPIRNESGNGLSNRRGTLAMARTNDPNSATAQFFINLVDNTTLDSYGGGYAVFGKVIAGMDVVDKIAQVPTGRKGPHDDVPQKPVVIKSARRKPGS